MQANREMLFQKCLTKSGRREGLIMESFIIDAAEKGGAGVSPSLPIRRAENAAHGF